MQLCKFPTGFGSLKRKNDFEVTVDGAREHTFKLGALSYRGGEAATEGEAGGRRVTLIHKISGERLSFPQLSAVIYRPEIELLKSGLNEKANGVSKSELLQQFGTSRDQRKLKENERQQVNVDAQKAVRSAQFLALKNERKDALLGNKLDKSYMDTGDDITSNLKEVQLSKIAPDEVLQSLSDYANFILSKNETELFEMVSERLLHQSVVTTIKKIPRGDMKKIQLCLLLDYMITFNMLNIKDVRKKVPIDECPDVVINFLLRRYTMTVLADNNKSTITVPKNEKEKLLMMILALFCYLNDYNFSVTELQVDLKTSTDRLRKHLNILDVKVLRATKTNDDKTTVKEFIASSKTPFVLDS